MPLGRHSDVIDFLKLQYKCDFLIQRPVSAHICQFRTKIRYFDFSEFLASGTQPERSKKISSQITDKQTSSGFAKTCGLHIDEYSNETILTSSAFRI